MNGAFLDAVQTRVEYARELKVHSLLGAPATRHRFSVEGDVVTVITPCLTLMQLLLDGVISSDRTLAVALEIEGHVSGSFRVEWVRVLDGQEYGQPVAIRFLKAAQ